MLSTMGVVLLSKEDVGKRCPLLYFSTVRQNPSSPLPSQASPSYTTGCCSPETRPQPEGHLHLPTGGVVALSTYSTCGGLTSDPGQGPWSLTSAVETRLQCRWVEGHGGMRGKRANLFKMGRQAGRQGVPVCYFQFSFFFQQGGLMRGLSGARPVPEVHMRCLACRFSRSGAISTEHPGTSVHFQVRSPPATLRHRVSTGNARSGS